MMFTAFNRLRYTVLQVLVLSYRYRHCRVIYYFIYRATRLHNSCSIKQNMLRDDISDFLLSGLKYETPGNCRIRRNPSKIDRLTIRSVED